MRSAAELHGEISHLHHADLLAVLLAKERHGAGLGFLQAHDLRRHRDRLGDLRVDDILNLRDLLLCHGREMGKVKAQPIRIHIRSRLLHMASQNLAQRFLAEGGWHCGSGNGASPVRIHLQRNRIAHTQLPGCHLTHMNDLSAHCLEGILYCETSLREDITPLSPI